jgi:ParB family chromosome partitioning protein
MTEKKPERRGLGRGLSALMADVMPAAEAQPRRPDMLLPVEKLAPNPDQPRRDFAPEALEELAASLRSKGMIQPIVARRDPRKPGGFEIVAGERRWRAAQLAQMHEVPVVVRDLDDGEVLEIAIIENIQRADLNALEEATAYRQLMDRFGHTQEKLAEALSKSRSHIANLLRLLTLPDPVQTWVRDGKLSAGHARALITSTDPVGLAREVINRGLSVRDTERLARTAAPENAGNRRRSGRDGGKDADTRALEQDLSAALGMRVVIDHKGQDGGVLSITYRSLDQLDGLCQVLNTLR